MLTGISGSKTDSMTSMIRGFSSSVASGSGSTEVAGEAGAGSGGSVRAE